MKRFLLVLAVGAVLAGCGSAVKLDNVPVEDKAGTSVTPGGTVTAKPGTDGVGTSNVAKVDLGKSGSDAAAPTGPRIIYFDFDSFAIRPEFQSVIENHAKYLKADKNRKAALEGHTDERGGREYNLALGQKRAEAVRQALGLLGVSDAQLEAVSFGKEKPAALGGDEDAMAKNRRTEITYR
jgi:peptidoglycan-associated lipoprotein